MIDDGLDHDPNNISEPVCVLASSRLRTERILRNTAFASVVLTSTTASLHGKGSGDLSEEIVCVWCSFVARKTDRNRYIAQMSVGLIPLWAK